jgi:N-acetylmuramoyl-L-alanine amidase
MVRLKRLLKHLKQRRQLAFLCGALSFFCAYSNFASASAPASMPSITSVELGVKKDVLTLRIGMNRSLAVLQKPEISGKRVVMRFAGLGIMSNQQRKNLSKAVTTALTEAQRSSKYILAFTCTGTRTLTFTITCSRAVTKCDVRQQPLGVPSEVILTAALDVPTAPIAVPPTTISSKTVPPKAIPPKAILPKAIPPKVAPPKAIPPKAALKAESNATTATNAETETFLSDDAEKGEKVEKVEKGEKPATDRTKWALDVIVIDPGHGGKDPGTTGTSGVREKDVVLGISNKLGALIRKNMTGTKVVHTRSDDRFIELDQRGQIANEAGGKLFVSIHCNSTPRKPTPAAGFEVYILRPGKNQEAVRVAEIENSVIRFETDAKKYKKLTDEQFIIVNMAQDAFVRFSDKFADLLVREVDTTTPLAIRGVSQAGFYVLVGASMPSVLIETAFLSNKKDEAYLKSERGQQKLAEAMFNAIKAYRTYYESELRKE